MNEDAATTQASFDEHRCGGQAAEDVCVRRVADVDVEIVKLMWVQAWLPCRHIYDVRHVPETRHRHTRDREVASQRSVGGQLGTYTSGAHRSTRASSLNAACLEPSHRLGWRSGSTCTGMLSCTPRPRDPPRDPPRDTQRGAQRCSRTSTLSRSNDKVLSAPGAKLSPPPPSSFGAEARRMVSQNSHAGAYQRASPGTFTARGHRLAVEWRH